MEVLISQHATLFEGLPADLVAGRLSRAPSGSASRALSPARHQTPPFEQQVQQQILQLQQASLNEQQQSVSVQSPPPVEAPPQQLTPQPLPSDDRPRLQPSSSADMYDVNTARPTKVSDHPQPPTSAGALPPVSAPSPSRMLTSSLAGMTQGGSGDSVYQLYQDSATHFLPHEPTLSSVPQNPQSAPHSASHTRASSLDHTLATPSPPLSAAGGRHVPPLEGAV